MISWFEKNSKISGMITFIGAIAIFYISSLKIDGGRASGILSIIYHFSAFFCLSFFLFISSVQGKKKYPVFVLVIIISITYGVLDELHQFFVPYRMCTLFDVGIDSLGILFSSILYFIRVKYRNNIK